MGNVGGAFAQSFAQTLIQGKQIMDQVADRREELTLRKKLVTAQLQEHETKTALATRKLEGIAGLRQRMTATEWPDSEFSAGGTQPAAPVSPQEWQKFGLEIDPDEVIKEGLKGGRRVDVLDLFERAVAAQGGGSAAAPAPGPTQPAEGPAAVADGQQAPGLGPQRKLDRTTSLSIGEDGKMKLDLKVGERNVQYRVDHETVVGPDGRAQVFRVITNPEDPRQTQRVPVGPAVPPAEIQKWAQAAESLGLKPGTALHETAVSDFLLVANTMQPGRAQEIAFADLAAKYSALAATGAQAPAGRATTSSPRGRAQAEEVEQTRKKSQASKEGEQAVPERAAPDERRRLEGPATAGDMYNQISAAYKPEYVGLIRGGVGATVREKTGVMAQQEQQFRTAVTAANNRMINEITGAAMSEPEALRILRQMPDPMLPPKQFEARLHMTKINNKIIAIRRRQVFGATGVDVSKLPAIILTTEERRAVAEPIAADYLKGQLTRAQAVQELMGLAQYGEQGAHAYLTAISGGKR